MLTDGDAFPPPSLTATSVGWFSSAVAAVAGGPLPKEGRVVSWGRSWIYPCTGITVWCKWAAQPWGAAPVCSHGSIDILKSPTLSARATAGNSSTESPAISAWAGPADTWAVAAAAAAAGGGMARSRPVRYVFSHTISSRRSPSKSRKMVSIKYKQTGGRLPSTKGKQLRRVARLGHENSSNEDCHPS